MLTYENFQKIFDQGKRSYWWLYQGKNKANGTPIGSNSDNPDLVESWEALNAIIECYGDGVYTIEVKSSPNSPKNNPVHTFYVGQQPTEISGLGRTGAPAPVDHSAAFTKGLDMRYWLDKSDQQAAEIRKLELEKLALQNQLQLERMKRKEAETAAGNQSGTDRIFGLLEKRPDILTSVVGLFTNGQPAPVAIGTLKAKQNPPQPPKNQQEQFSRQDHEYEFPDGEDEEEYFEEYEDGDGEEVTRFSIDRAVSACYRLIQALPDQDINALLEKLAGIAETNPDKIRTALTFL